jgi:hypothetical protein
VIGLAANYAALSARLGSVERTVERVEARVWELRGSRASLLGIVPDPCVQDATMIRLTLTPEDLHGTHR